MTPYLPGGTGPFGHSSEIRADRLGFLQRIAAEAPDLARLRSPGTLTVSDRHTYGGLSHVYLVNTPELYHEVLVEKARSYTKSYVLQFALRPIGGDGLFLSEGDLWKRQRRTMAPLFHTQQLGRYVEDMRTIAERSALALRDGQVIGFADEMTRVTMSIAGKTLFDADTFNEADELGHALTVALDWASENAPSMFSIAHAVGRAVSERIAKRVPPRASGVFGKVADRLRNPLFAGPGGKPLAEAIEILDARVARMIDDRRKQAAPPDDLLSRLLDAKDEHGQPMSHRQIRDEILTLFVAGHETTATALAWAMYELAQNPELTAAAEAEVDALGHSPTPADLPRLPLLLRIFKEALRKYPPVFMFSRQVQETTTLAGATLQPRAIVFLAPFVLHRRPDLYPDPERFDPDRFLPEAEKARPRFGWVPFGAGPRVCIGAQFALLEGQMVLATLMYHARFSAEEKVVPEPLATLRPKGSMPMRVRLRRATV